MAYGVVPPGTSVADGTAVLTSPRPTRPSGRAEYGNAAAEEEDEAAALIKDASGTYPREPLHKQPSLKVTGKNHSKFDSLDYDLVENAVYRGDQASQTHLDSIAYAAMKWSICFLIGVVTAGAAFIVNMSVENIAGFKFWATLTLLENRSYFGSYLVLTAINCTLVLGASIITVYYAPAAAGSGIPEVKAYLNGIDVPGIFLLRTLVAKVIGSVGAVAGGMATGKEGPFVHAGACIAALLSQGGTSEHVSPLFSRFWNDRDRNDMVTCGAAAGVAAAFRSPVGGVLFALEEMTSWWRNQLMWLVFFTTAVVSVTVRVMMKMCNEGSCGFFGSGGFIIFEIAEGQDNYEFYELLPMLLLGVVGGLLGSCFNVLNGHMFRLRQRYLAPWGKRGKVAEALAVVLLTSTVSFIVPFMFPCQDCPIEAGNLCPRLDNAHSGNFIHFTCPDHKQYNGLATIFFNTQDDAIRNLFSSKTKQEYSVPALLTFTTVFYLLSVVTYGMALPTGLFVPAILCGAAYGRLVGIFVADVQSRHNIDEGTYALLGAASFLGGSMRMTVCTCVMLLELTNNLALLPLVMLVLLVAKAVGDGTGVYPIYESAMALKDLPYLPPGPERFMRHITAAESCGRPPVTLQRVERVRTLVACLRDCQHNGFPVVSTSAEGERSIMGIILRHHILVLLQTKRAFQPSPFVGELSSRVAFGYSLAEFSKPVSTPGLRVEDLRLSDEQLDLWVDLGPYASPSYYVVPEGTSLSKVYTLFRTLGLRHLAVIPKAQEVVGMISRRDLLPEVLEDKVGSNFVAYNPGTGYSGGPRSVSPNGWGAPDEHVHNGDSAWGSVSRRPPARQPAAVPPRGPQHL